MERTGKAGTDDDNTFDMMVYRRFNKNLKTRFQFINKIMDWNEFSDSIVNPRDNRYGGNRWNRNTTYANPNLIEEANAKEHFAYNKSSLLEVLEDVYFPVVSPQEHDDMYSRHDMAIK